MAHISNPKAVYVIPLIVFVTALSKVRTPDGIAEPLKIKASPYLAMALSKVIPGVI
jgi:hypothetical protein